MTAPVQGEGRRGPTGTLVAVGVGALAVLCCAGWPLVAGILGGLTAAGPLGAGAGVLVAGAAVGLGAACVRSRRRRVAGSALPAGSQPPEPKP